MRYAGVYTIIKATKNKIHLYITHFIMLYMLWTTILLLLGLFSQRLITPEPIRPLQQTFHAPVKEHLILASGMTPQDFQKKIVGSRVKRVIPPVKESYQYEKQAMFVDAGLFMGRSFRVGWGPGWTLAHCGEVIKPVRKGEYTCIILIYPVLWQIGLSKQCSPWSDATLFRGCSKDVASLTLDLFISAFYLVC